METRFSDRGVSPFHRDKPRFAFFCNEPTDRQHPPTTAVVAHFSVEAAVLPLGYPVFFSAASAPVKKLCSGHPPSPSLRRYLLSLAYLWCLEPLRMLYVVAGPAQALEVIIYQCKLGMGLQVFNVMHRSGPTVSTVTLAPLTLMVVPLKDLKPLTDPSAGLVEVVGQLTTMHHSAQASQPTHHYYYPSQALSPCA